MTYASATTAITCQAKTDFFNGGMCLATVTTLTCTCSSTTAMTAMGGSGISGIAVGMAVTGTNTAANTVVAQLTGQSTLTLSNASTGALTNPTFTGDVMYISLINNASAQQYNNLLVNAGTPGTGTPSVTNIGTDACTNTSGSAYTAGGLALANVLAVLSSQTAVGSFSTTIQWTSASFSVYCGVIYNKSARLGGASGGITPGVGSAGTTSTIAVNHTVSVHDFGGVQTVSAGTFTLVVPTANSSTGLLRIA